MREVEGWQLIATKAQCVCAPQCVFFEQRHMHRWWCAQAIEKARHEFIARASAWLHEIRQRLHPTGDGQRVKPRGQLCKRLVPGHFPILAAAASTRSFHRMSQAIRVIGHFDRRLPTRAQSAMVDGMRRQAFELLGDGGADDAALAVSDDIHVGVQNAHVQAAAGRAERADRRLPGRNARHELVIGDEPDDLVLGMTATGQRRARPRNRGDLEKPTSIHAHLAHESDLVDSVELVVTRQAVIRGSPLGVAIDAKSHRQIDVSLRYRLLCDCAVAGRAVDIRSKMRSVVEPDVRFTREAVYALPRQVLSLRFECSELLDPRAFGRDRR